MATNYYYPFGTGAGANVLPISAYSALPARQTGFQAGDALSVQLNSVWRQSSEIASMIGQVITDYALVDAADDGNLVTLEANFVIALKAIATTQIPSATDKWYFGVDSGTADALVITPSPPVTAWSTNVCLSVIKGANANATTTPTIAPSGLSPKVIVRNDGSALAIGDLTANACGPMQYDGANVRLMAAIAPGQVKTKLSGNLTVYIRTDGNDLNNGLANTAGGAFQTLQGAWNKLFSFYDAAGYSITLQIGLAGTYAGLLMGQYTGSVTINGSAGSPSTYIINCPGTNNYVIQSAVKGLVITNCLLDYTFSGSASGVEGIVLGVQGASIIVGGCTYRCSASRAAMYENYVQQNSEIDFQVGTTITSTGAGTRASFAAATSGGIISATNAPGTTTFSSSGTMAYAVAFASASNGSKQVWIGASFGGFVATGPRYSALLISLINTGGGGATFLPGNSAGSIDASSVYV